MMLKVIGNHFNLQGTQIQSTFTVESGGYAKLFKLYTIHKILTGTLNIHPLLGLPSTLDLKINTKTKSKESSAMNIPILNIVPYHPVQYTGSQQRGVD